MKKLSVYLAMFFVCATVFGLNLAQAQTQATTDNNKSRNEQIAAEFRFDTLVAQARPMRRVGFSLIPSSNNGNTGASGSKMTPAGVVSVSGKGSYTLGSKQTVQAMIETTLGGLTFPNGTLQPASAGAPPLFSVAHDDTLQGHGTSGSPLGIKVPLTLSGLLTVDGVARTNTTSGNAVEAKGGDGGNRFGGAGVVGTGGQSFETGGSGVVGIGGLNIGPLQLGQFGRGGTGVSARGGDSTSGGQSGTGSQGGIGVDVLGGSSNDGDGGTGLVTTGGFARGSGNRGGIGIIATSGLGSVGAGQGLAGQFFGSVEVGGNLSKGGGSFKIDHPLDPANKYLYHSFVESPDMMNIYNGNVKLDSNGEATVELPDWFGTLNKDFRYSLTALGAPGPNLYIATEVADNHFKIAGGAPGMKISWQVTGIRQDAWANAHRIPIEEDKSEKERGHYLHPELYGQPEEKSILMVQHPEIMRQMKEAQEKAQREKLQ